MEKNAVENVFQTPKKTDDSTAYGALGTKGFCVLRKISHSCRWLARDPLHTSTFIYFQSPSDPPGLSFHLFPEPFWPSWDSHWLIFI
jgi:hypothetical protein